MDLILTKQAEKDLARLPRKEQTKAIKKMELLARDPLLGKKLAGKLALFRSLRFWPYRIIYHVQNKKEIWIDHVIHRQGAYK